MKLDLDSNNFRFFSPDENNSNRWQDILEVTNRCFMADIYPEDDPFARRSCDGGTFRTPMPRLARRLLADGSAWFLQLPPFDMCVLNDLDRFHLVVDAIDRVPQLGSQAEYAKQWIRDRLIEHNLYINEHGEDMPEIRDWQQWKASPNHVRSWDMLMRLKSYVRRANPLKGNDLA